MPKYRCTLSVDKDWVDRFNLVFDVDDEQDYITVYADEEDEQVNKQKG